MGMSCTRAKHHSPMHTKGLYLKVLLEFGSHTTKGNKTTISPLKAQILFAILEEKEKL